MSVEYLTIFPKDKMVKYILYLINNHVDGYSLGLSGYITM